jgi:hypothetical protein
MWTGLSTESAIPSYLSRSMPAYRITLSRLFLALLVLSLWGCARTVRLKPFASDGCSLFPDGDSRSGSWCACCVDHDFAYWKGGPDEERRAADSALGECILARTSDSTLARTVYLGTRAGGSSYFPTWYRWGYGWPYGMSGVNAAPDSARAGEIRKRAAAMDRAAAARGACGEDGPAPKGAISPK